MTETDRLNFFTIAHRDHSGWVRKLVSRAVSGEDLHDVTQNVWLSVLRSAHTYNPQRGSITTWLSFIARHEIANYLRDRLRTRGHTPITETVADRSLQVPRDEREELARLLQNLHPRDAETLHLWARGLNSRAVATVSGEPRSASRERLQKTIKRARALTPQPHPSDAADPYQRNETPAPANRSSAAEFNPKPTRRSS